MSHSLPQSIIDHYEDPFQQGGCQGATHRAEGEHVGLESEVIVIELRVVGEEDDAVIDEACFDGEGSRACLGAASMLVEHVQQKTIHEVEQLSEPMFAELLGIELDAEYAESCLLSLRVLREAIESPIDDESGPMFFGPNLGEEC